MADDLPRGPGGLGRDVGLDRDIDDLDDLDDIEPIDPDEFRQIQLLNEASLVSFTAEPAQLQPFGKATLAWHVAMPTTDLPGVNVEVLLHLPDVDPVMVTPQGSRPVMPFARATYHLTLRAPKAARHLGTLELEVDIAACTFKDTTPIELLTAVRQETDRAFPAGGEVHLRGSGPTLDLGAGSLVVDLPLTAPIPNWFNADIDVAMGFGVGAAQGQLRVTHTLTTTSVTFGTASSILSAGCDEAVEKAVEVVTTGLIDNFIGPEIARRMAQTLQTDVIDAKLRQLNGATPPPASPYRLYEVLMTADGLTCRFCPSRPAGPVTPLGGDPLEEDRPVGPG